MADRISPWCPNAGLSRLPSGAPSGAAAILSAAPSGAPCEETTPLMASAAASVIASMLSSSGGRGDDEWGLMEFEPTTFCMGSGICAPGPE